MDLVSSTMLATTLGAGCMLAAGSVLVVEGLLVLLAQLVAPFLTAYPAALAEMTCAGSLLILAVGHTFNLGINALGAYVHSCRLQYIEFFGKFYKEGGRAFSPLKIRTKYVDVVKEEK